MAIQTKLPPNLDFSGYEYLLSPFIFTAYLAVVLVFFAIKFHKVGLSLHHLVMIYLFVVQSLCLRPASHRQRSP